MENWNNYLQEEEPIDEGFGKKLLTTLALIGGLAGSPDAKSAIQADPDTIAQQQIDIDGETFNALTNKDGTLNDATAGVIVSLLRHELDPLQYPGAAEAADIFSKAHRSKNIRQLDNMPYVAQAALAKVVDMLNDAKKEENLEGFGAWLRMHLDKLQKSPDSAKLKTSRIK